MNGMSASLSGLQASALSVAVASHNIGNAAANEFQARRLDQASLPQGGVEPEAIRESQEPPPSEGNNVNLANEAVDLKTDKLTYEANLQFLQIQSAMLGTALDMKA